MTNASTRINNKKKYSNRSATSWDRNALSTQQLVAVLRGLHRRQPAHYNEVLICIRSAVDRNTIFLNSPFTELQSIEVRDIVQLSVDGSSCALESLSCPKVQMAVVAFQENPDANAFIFIGSNDSEPFSLLGRRLEPISRHAVLWQGLQANLSAAYQETGPSGAKFRELISKSPYMIVQSEGICVCESSLERALVAALAGDNACRLQLATANASQLTLIPDAEIPGIRAFEMNTLLVERKMAGLCEYR
ncbi:class II aldolase/adducin family protein [Umboniibacter marinipuniceus]|uniref:Ribulose-5-phosphate 4-epimerase/fuculose-1-phosphate aldolase n=1 Tax=Umboniibacter marinipuniceus TaxID=569599 RepID=A0A3M0A3R9_9GAMM|nr:class II aldolase/adducin family protein [Umboniibacter marinipuniceus]RMA79306.1 ribulose-5-phosphate 4-epimerase/fuculose-1-phosphate aldolase [Umboniibacter marinipuniceus]